MKYLLTLIIITFLISCGGPPDQPLQLQASYRCKSNALVIGATGKYPKGQEGQIEIYKDANQNKKFDADDRIERQEFTTFLKYGEFYLSEPIELEQEWVHRLVFIVLRSGSDSTMIGIHKCLATEPPN